MYIHTYILRSIQIVFTGYTIRSIFILLYNTCNIFVYIMAQTSIGGEFFDEYGFVRGGAEAEASDTMWGENWLWAGHSVGHPNCQRIVRQNPERHSLQSILRATVHKSPLPREPVQFIRIVYLFSLPLKLALTPEPQPRSQTKLLPKLR